MSKNLKERDLKLPQIKFPYNQDLTYFTSHFPFITCYGVNPLTIIDLLPFSIEYRASFDTKERTKEVKKLHDQIRDHAEKVNASYTVRANKNMKA